MRDRVFVSISVYVLLCGSVGYIVFVCLCFVTCLVC